MAFVAEYISKEDIKKYGVIDIVNSSRAILVNFHWAINV